MKKEEKKTYWVLAILGLVLVLALFANKGGTDVGQAAKTATVKSLAATGSVSTEEECIYDENYDKLCICQPEERSVGLTPSASLCEKCTDVCEEQGDECIGAVKAIFNPDASVFQLVSSGCDEKSS